MTHLPNRRTFLTTTAAAPLASLPIPAPAEETFAVHGLSMNAAQKSCYDLGWSDGRRALLDFIETLVAEHEPDPHPQWLDEWQALTDRYNAKNLSETEETAVWEAREALGAKIYRTPARTHAGIIAQLDYWLLDWGDILLDGEESPEIVVIEKIRDGIANFAT